MLKTMRSVILNFKSYSRKELGCQKNQVSFFMFFIFPILILKLFCRPKKQKIKLNLFDCLIPSWNDS